MESTLREYKSPRKRFGDKNAFAGICTFHLVRSTPPSPNKVGLKCPFVCPQKVSSISMTFGM